jgi:hypothetical protein
MNEYEVNKPVSMTVKDWLVKRLSLDMMISESVIHRVVDHQMNGVRKALETNKSVEVSGFGKFLFNQKKAERKLVKLYDIKKQHDLVIADETQLERKRASAEFKLHKLMMDIELLKKRICE